MIVSYDRPEQTQTAADAEKRAGRACARLRNRPAANTRLAGRFLVLIASNVRLTPQQLGERLDATLVTATDLPTTMTAIADALYFGRTATWSGYYTRW
ncbi:MAG TPA: hypothetical protein VM076_09400 [Gemmatimonadaceae bacterium]|nr:hypothetical protein [Gemmatimonadaceae bacterium]